MAQMEFSQRSAVDLALYPFVHGVASGDPLHDRVIIWTRLTSEDSGSLAVNWRVATDTGLVNVVQSGTAWARPERDRTIKVDVDSLQPNHWYYYEFEYQGRKSLIGRTRTAPLGPVDSIRVAVLSCTCYQCGFFNPYAIIADRNDLDLVIHVGDYFYEYPAEGYGYTLGLDRLEQPANELISLADYRIRHSWYKLDPDSRKIHQNYPFIIIFDDHEFSNDAWKGGAQHHDEATEGTWAKRLKAGYRAWMEWQPVREPADADDYLAYKELPFGDLLDFVVVDTRIHRDQQDLTKIDDPTRTMLGPVQYNWLVEKLTQSSARWKVLVNQTMMAPLETFGGNVWSFEQWDGYRAERQRLLDTVVHGGVDNFVVLTGDIHSAWVYNLRHNMGSAGVEFVVTSSTALSRGISTWSPSVLYALNPHIKYMDLNRRGYMVVDFNRERTQCDQIYVPTNLVRSLDNTVGGSWQVNAGTTEAVLSPGPSVRLNPGPDKPPAMPVNSCFIPRNADTRSISANSAVIEWDDSPDADFYKIEGRIVGTPDEAITRVTRTNWKYIGSLVSGTSYEWRVSSICKSGASSSFSNWQEFTTSDVGLRESDEDSVLLFAEPMILSIHPSPFQTEIGIHFQIELKSIVRMELWDMQGEKVFEQFLGTFAPGLYFREFTIDASIPSGVYSLRLFTRNSFVEKRVVKQ